MSQKIENDLRLLERVDGQLLLEMIPHARKRKRARNLFKGEQYGTTLKKHISPLLNQYARRSSEIQNIIQTQ